MKAATTHPQDLILPYVNDLQNVIDMEVIRTAGIKIAVDPLGGSSGPYWEPIRDVYHVDITVVNQEGGSNLFVHERRSRRQDPHGLLQPLCHGKSCQLKDQYQIAFANDPDADRHGIVTRSSGLMNPNHYLAVAIHYLLTHRPLWPRHPWSARPWSAAASSIGWRMELGRRLFEVPVGFKWFSPGLFDGSCCFGGEESAGASFLQKDGRRMDNR